MHKFNLKCDLMVTACMLATEMAAPSTSCYHIVQTSAASPSLKRPFSGSNSIQWTLRVHQVSLYQLFVPFNTITLESVIDVGQGISVGPGKFDKKNKRRALNTHVLCSK